MKKAILLAALMAMAACDAPPPTPEQQAQMQKEQDSLDRQQLELECFQGNQKSCDDVQKLREIDAVGDIIDDASAG